MVNTFVTSSDFDQSARWLDPSHLWKQILEATQILRLLEDLAMIAEHYHSKSIPPAYRGTDPSKLATNFLARCAWVKETCSTYMHLKTRFVYRLKEGQLKKTVVSVAESKTLTEVRAVETDGDTVCQIRLCIDKKDHARRRSGVVSWSSSSRKRSVNRDEKESTSMPAISDQRGTNQKLPT